MHTHDLKPSVLVDTLPYAVLFTRNNRVIYANFASLETFCMASADELIGLEVRNFVAEEDQDRVMAYANARFLGDPSVPAVYSARFRRGDGTIYPGIICAQVMPFEGEPAIQVTVLDISQHEEVRNQLRQSEAEKQAVLEANRKLQEENAERLRAEAALRIRQEQTRQFQARLRTLHEVSMQLADAESFDVLCYKAIELGLAQLGFERIGLWLFSEETNCLIGSYGTDETGQLRDERGVQLPIPRDSPMDRLFHQNIPLIHLENAPIYSSLDLKVIGPGYNAAATVWNGNRVLGLLSIDTLLTGSLIDDQACEILMMYATTLGHLCTIKQQETALRNRETQLAGAQRIGRMGNWIQHLALDEVALSEETCRILGFDTSVTSISKQQLMARVHPDERQALLELEQRAVNGMTSYDIEYRIFHLDGTECWVRACAEIVYDTNGTPEQLIGTLQDVSEQHRTQESLRRRLKIMELVADSSARFVGIHPEELNKAVSQVVESVGRFQHVDWVLFAMMDEHGTAWAQHWQWYRTDVFGEGAPIIHSPSLFPWVQKILNRRRVFQVSDVKMLPTMAIAERALFEENNLQSCLVVPVILEGRIVAMLTLASTRTQTIRPDDIQFAQILADLLANAVYRAQAEVTLRNSEEKFRSLVTGLQDAVYVVSIPDGVCRYISPAAEHVLGYSAEALMHDPRLIHHALHLDSANGSPKVLSDILQERAVPNVFEYRLIDKDGKDRWILESNRIVYDSQGRATSIEGICRNVTEEKRAYQTVAELSARLNESAKLSVLGEIAANIAHEVNNPLAAISGSAEQLATALQEPDQYPPETPQQLVQAIARNSIRIRNMVKGLRNFSRDATQDPFEIAPIKEIVEDSVALCSAHFLYHHLSLTVRDLPVELTVPCRPTQILEILVNLLNNALIATIPLSEKWVELAVTEDEKWVIISVTDSGCGVPADQVERIFQPFVTTRPHGAGTGLGLTIARNIAQHHNGTLCIDTACPNTRFVVRLPKRQEDA